MKSTIFLIILASVLLLSFVIKQKSVENPQEKTETNLEDDYRIYDKTIREAWAFHKPKGDYPNMFKKYREAFNSVSSPMAIDVLDALKRAIEVDSVELMFAYSEILVKRVGVILFN